MANDSQGCVPTQVPDLMGWVGLDSQPKQEHTACCGFLGFVAPWLWVDLGTKRDGKKSDFAHSLLSLLTQFRAHSIGQ